MYAGTERRIDHDRRLRVREMTREEMIRELMTDHLTGIGSKRAFDEQDGEGWVAIVDADGLKWVNDNWGHAAGDALLKNVGQSLAKEGFDVYRVGGDEFAVVLSEMAEVARFVAFAEAVVRRSQFSWAGTDGLPYRAIGARISIGVGRTAEKADQVLLTMKGVRAKIGLRSGRGEVPPGLKLIDNTIGRLNGGFRPVLAGV